VSSDEQAMVMGQEVEIRMSDRNQLIEQILEIELRMFLATPSREHAVCQDSPDGFILTRGSVFELWSTETLESYLEDLRQAETDGRNLMAEKYARMENLIPCTNINPAIGEIVEIETAWQDAVRAEYPHLMDGRPETGICKAEFDVYLRCELETYSRRTLKCYLANDYDYLERGVNQAEEKYLSIVRKLGYATLEEAEKKAAEQEAASAEASAYDDGKTGTSCRPAKA
jgi:hypothetical protein